MTWPDAYIAAAFIAGLVLGAAATIRVTQIVLQYMTRRERRG